jgi:hypothetical protein
VKPLSLVLAMAVLALTFAVSSGEDSAPLVNRFMNSLPYQVAYSRIENPPLPSYEYGQQFLAIKRTSCGDSLRVGHSFQLVSSALLFQRDYYPYYFPSKSEPCPKFTTPQGDSLAFLVTAKPLAPSDSIERVMEIVVQQYAVQVRDYEFARGDYEKQKFEAYLTLVAYPLMATTAGIMMSSKHKNTRTAGYISAVVVGVGLVVDTKSIIEWFGKRKKAGDKRLVLENWSESNTNRILDSLNARK